MVTPVTEQFSSSEYYKDKLQAFSLMNLHIKS